MRLGERFAQNDVVGPVRRDEPAGAKRQPVEHRLAALRDRDQQPVPRRARHLELNLAAAIAEADLGDRDALQTHILQRFLHLVEFKGLDDGFNFLQGRPFLGFKVIG